MAPSSMTVDVAVIGAGTAGMNAYSTLRRAGARAVLIDQGPLGTTCARVGCMPSKAVLHAAQRWDGLRQLMPAGMPQAQWRAALPKGHATPQQLWQEALQIRDQLVQGNVRQLHALADSDLLQTGARFAAPDLLELGDGRRVQARAFVVATGSEARKPAQLQEQLGAALITTDELFALHDLPHSVAVWGMGAIGLEMGVALSRLGVQVVATGRNPVLAKIADPEVAKAAQTYFAHQMPMALGCRDVLAERRGDMVRFEAGALKADVQYVLVTQGRSPRLADLALDQAGVRFDAQGRPLWDRASLRCLDSRVFLAGDATGERPLMHEAAQEGTIAAQQALRAVGDARWQDLPVRGRSVPLSIVFSAPDVAEVGLRFSELPPEAVVVTARGAGNGRSKIMQAPEHVLRLYADPASRQLLGASLLCAGGEHLAHLLAWAIQRADTVEQLLALPYYHPTVEEMLDNALRDLRKQLRAA